jgi:hypothetical protein
MVRMAGKGMRIGATNLPAPTLRACGFLGSVLSVAAKSGQSAASQHGPGGRGQWWAHKVRLVTGRIRCVFLARSRNVRVQVAVCIYGCTRRLWLHTDLCLHTAPTCARSTEYRIERLKARKRAGERERAGRDLFWRWP